MSSRAPRFRHSRETSPMKYVNASEGLLGSSEQAMYASLDVSAVWSSANPSLTPGELGAPRDSSIRAVNAGGHAITTFWRATTTSSTRSSVGFTKRSMRLDEMAVHVASSRRSFSLDASEL